MASTVNVTKNYIPQIDYVSRDYTAILSDLTAIAKQFNPTWAVSDPADIGVALLETFAYLGDILSFYTDRMASEGFLGTASQRSSVLAIAAMLGYTPTPSSAAVVSLNITNNNSSGGASITIPALSQVSSTTIVNGQSTQVTFELDTAVTVAAAATVGATATQGVTTSNEALGTSDGTPSQQFKLSQTGVIINSTGSNISVYVGGVLYNYSSTLADNSAYDSVYTTTMDADGYTYILFGDGVGGRIPPATYSITATYRVGVGSAGNIALGSLASTFTNLNVNATVAQLSAGIGGADDESTDSIRINTPRALRTLRRAVSLKDYAYLALNVTGVSKANADASVWSNVNLYIAPFGSSALTTYTYTGVTAVAQTAIDGTAGTGYLTYTAPNGTFTTLTANSSYVTITGSVPVAYNIYTPALVTNVAANGSTFTVQTAMTAFPTYSSSAASTIAISAYGTNTSAFNTLVSGVVNYFTDKVAPNVTLTVKPPTYVPVNLDMTLHVLPQYSQSTVVTQVNSALSNLVSYNNAFFADRIPPHFLLNAITNIDGVDYATVEHLRRNSNEQIFTVSNWTRTASTATLNTTNTHNIVPGQNVKLYDIGASIDGTYGVNSVTGTSITFTVPTGTASATGVTVSSTTTPITSVIPVSSVTGISVGMYVTGTNIPANAVVNSVGTSTIAISIPISNTVTSGTALTFTFPPTATDNYVKVVTVDSTTSAGVITSGIVCAANEIPTKGTFNITATGGLA